MFPRRIFCTARNLMQSTHNKVSYLNNRRILTPVAIQKNDFSISSITYQIVDYDYVVNSMHNKDIYVIDVREPEEVEKHGCVPDSINIPLSEIKTVFGEWTDEQFLKEYNRHKPKPDTEIIFYCKVGRRSGYALEDAAEVGYNNCKNYLGSWREWKVKAAL